MKRSCEYNVKCPRQGSLHKFPLEAGTKNMAGKTSQRKFRPPLGLEGPVINLDHLVLVFPLLLYVFFLGNVVAEEDMSRQLPKFLEAIPNKTVVVGRDVILPCSVDNLKGYKVAWIFVETQTILTIHHTIITKNPRFSLARHDHKHWYLQISDVKPSDRGLYMCQVNSDPMMSQIGFLDVQVPPDIIDTESSSEVVVQEGHDVALRCKARGSPRPLISWKREDGNRIHPAKGINLKVSDSEVLRIPKVSRLHMGAYLCIASNKVPPSVSKRIMLKVQFAPVLWIPNQLMGVSKGNDVTLECNTEAFPRSINYWTDSNGLMILSNEKYDGIVAENGYKAYMRLKIKGVTESDFGTFGCTAKNSFGESNGTIKVYEIPEELLVTPPKMVGKEGDADPLPEGRDRNRASAKEDDHKSEESPWGHDGRLGKHPSGNESVPATAPDGTLFHIDHHNIANNNWERKRGRSSSGGHRGYLPIDLHLPTSKASPPHTIDLWRIVSLCRAVCLSYLLQGNFMR